MRKDRMKQHVWPTRALIVLALVCALNTWLHWPSDDDRNAGPWLAMASTAFYTQAYSATDELRYQEAGRIAAENAQIVNAVSAFVRRFNLQNRRVLDVGAGRGYLQDVVHDYVGLDISPTARQFFHKPCRSVRDGDAVCG